MPLRRYIVSSFFVFLSSCFAVAWCRSAILQELAANTIDSGQIQNDTVLGVLDFTTVSTRSSGDDEDPDLGSPLVVTPYIERGDIRTAQELSRVVGDPFPENVISYSGFFTVDEQFNSNLFFWFFKAEFDYDSAPVIVWLQGGPGATSMYGLFTEIGPFYVAPNSSKLLSRYHSWTKNFSVIFIDNPVGAGFSYTEDDEGYSTNQTHIGENLYFALLQFLQMFPELQERDLYLAGESYAGKYIPSLAYQIYKRKNETLFSINLQCLILGNAFSDPVNMLDYSDLLFHLGLVDTTVKDMMKEEECLAKENIRNGSYLEALTHWENSLRLFLEKSYYTNFWNFLNNVRPNLNEQFMPFLDLPEIRRLIHVGNVSFVNTGIANAKLVTDLMMSVRPWVEELLDNGYRVVYYSGQLDIIVAYSLSVKMFEALNFNAAEEYRNAERKPWFVDGELAGYYKTAGNFTEVLVRNAGHMVPMDKPDWALDLISKIVNNSLE